MILIIIKTTIASFYRHIFFNFSKMTIFILSVILGIATTLVSGWLPSDRNLAAFNRGASPAKIRGVNLGGWLLSEPWMMDQEWREMGCYDGNTKMASEFDCVSFLTQNIADSAFNDHYARWITTDDIQQIFNAGLNTIRIPIGYWSFRDIVRDTEHFPEMNLTYLDKVVAKAASLGMFVIIDLHGAPGAQKLEDAFTGQVCSCLFKTAPVHNGRKLITILNLAHSI